MYPYQRMRLCVDDRNVSKSAALHWAESGHQRAQNVCFQGLMLQTLIKWTGKDESSIGPTRAAARSCTAALEQLGFWGFGLSKTQMNREGGPARTAACCVAAALAL